jgi:hypothetical protein
MENEERAERGKEIKARKTHLEKLLLGCAGHSSAAPSISHIASDMVLLQAPSGVGPSARMRCWTYLLELRLRGDLAAPVTHSQRIKERCKKIKCIPIMRARAEAETCHRCDTVH